MGSGRLLCFILFFSYFSPETLDRVELHMLRIPLNSLSRKGTESSILHSNHPRPPTTTSDDPSPWHSLISLSCSGLLTPLIEMGMSIKEPKNLLPGPHFKGTVGRRGWGGGGASSSRLNLRIGVCARSEACVGLVSTSWKHSLIGILRRRSCCYRDAQQRSLGTVGRCDSFQRQVYISKKNLMLSVIYYRPNYKDREL